MTYGSKNIYTGVRFPEVPGTIGSRLRLRPYTGIVLRSDEDDRSSVLYRGKSLAQVNPGHPFELDVKQYAVKPGSICIREESFGREVGDGLKVSGP